MVKEFCNYVIIGHSERRRDFAETDEIVNAKVKAAFGVGLLPIMCVGETLEENESGRTAEVVTRQVKAGLTGLSPELARALVIAYEPVWAIGTGRASTADAANQVIAETIRKPLAELFGADVAEAVRVLYGGSVTGANAAEFFGMPEIDGALVGGAGADYTKPLALVELQNGGAAPSFVAGTDNFYAVTRYNWSSYYAMAVIDLGDAVAAARARDTQAAP